MDEQQHAPSPQQDSSGIAKLGKIFSSKIFSDRILYWFLLALAFFLPLFFVPGGVVAPEFAKMILLEVVVFVGIFLWAIGRLRDGAVAFPKSWLLLVGLLILVQFIVAAVVSPAPMVSFVGSGYDLGTVNSFIVLFLLMFLSSIVFSNRDRILSLFLSVLGSGVVVVIYHLLRYFFGADFLDFNVFTSSVLTPVGKWNDFASLSGALIIFVLSTLYFFPENKLVRIPAYLLFFVCLFFLLLIDFTVLWSIMVVAMVLFGAFAVYEGEQKHRALLQSHEEGAVKKHKPAHKRIAGHLPLLAVVLFAVALLYASGLSRLTWGNDNASIAALIGKTLKTAPYSEVVLTPQFTANIITQTVKESPFFGTSPNRFSSGYLKYKTEDINQTVYWDTTFDFGLGHIPTFFSTTGIIGMLLWLAFIALLFLKGRKVFALFAKDRIAAFLAFTLFLLALYFWSIAFLYLPNIAIFALAFLFTGALIAFLVHEGVLHLWKIEFAKRSRLSFVFTPVLIMLLIGVVACGTLLYRQFSSLVAFRDAQLALGKQDVAGAQEALLRANGLFERDVYHRGLSSLALANLEQLATQNVGEAELAERANTYITGARSHAERAIAVDPTNFENYLQLGGVYDTLSALNVQNAAQFARDNYHQALDLNPHSPRILFVLARLELRTGDRAKAKEYLYQALALRPSFLEAIAFIIQLELQDNNEEKAVEVLEKGVLSEPTNFLLRFSLGYLYFTGRDYDRAIPELELAIVLNPVYANAKYFLGLAYAEKGRPNEAIAQFTDVQTLNPDNEEVARILRNLKAGRNPLQGTAPQPAGALPPELSGN